MSTDPNTPPPANPPAGDPPPANPPAPEPKAAEKKLLDDLKKAQAKAKELEAKLADALPYVEKFKGHDEAKALEAQRAAETRAKQESEARARQELEGKRERAILKALIGVVPLGVEGAGEFALWKLQNDPSVVLDPETGTLGGLPEALEALKAHPLLSLGKTPEVKKAAPGLPETKVGAPARNDQIKSYDDLLKLGAPAVVEFAQKDPERYAALRAAHFQGLASPTRTIPPAAMKG